MMSNPRQSPAFELLDRPIERVEDDLLNRRGFVDGLVRALSERESAEPIAIGVCGPWGSGKTSLRNLITGRLKDRGSPTLILFEPWLLSGAEHIVSDLLRSVLGSFEHGTELRPGFRALLSRFLNFGANAAQVGTVVAAAQGQPEIALATQAISTGLSSTRASVDALASGETIHALKAEVDEAFRRDPRRFLVIIDDIDRLQPVEIGRLFQAIRASFAFPRVDYLLFFQRQTVEAALTASEVVDGRAYLEKLVPVVLDVPQVAPSTLIGFLESAVGDVLARRIAGEPAFGNRIDAAGRLLCGQYVSSLRGLKRLLSGFEFHLGVHTVDGHLEVDPIDLLLLEAIRLFEPDVYGTLYASRDLLVESVDRVVQGAAAGQSRSKVIETRVLKNARYPETTRAVLSTLFPVVGEAAGGGVWRDEATAVKGLRICVAGFFERYFQLHLAKEDFPQASLRLLLQRAASRPDMIRELRKIPAGLPGLFAMHRIRYSLFDLSPEGSAPLLSALCDMLEERTGISFIHSHLNFEFVGGTALAVEILRREEESHRGAVLRAAFSLTSSYVLGALLVERETDCSKAERVLAAEDLDVLQAEIVGRIAAVSATPAFMNEGTRLLHALFWWKRFGDHHALEKWFDDLDPVQFEALTRKAFEGWPEGLGIAGPEGSRGAANPRRVLDAVFGSEVVAAKVARLSALSPGIGRWLESEERPDPET